MKQQPKYKIGVIIYTKVGTNTSILLDEFKFFNDFHSHNPDCEFVFIAVSDYTKKSIIANKHHLNFDEVSIIKVSSEEDLHKLDPLSGVFSYMTRNTFFGGAIDRSCATNYMISAYCTNELDIPLFIRTPDSEYPYMDYRQLAYNRTTSGTESAEKFKTNNKHELDRMPKPINYENVWFIANGMRGLYDWVVDIAHNDIPENMRMMTADKIKEKTIYVSDASLFNVTSHYEKYSYLSKNIVNKKFIFIGYLKGSVAKNRLKALPKIFKENKHIIPTDIIGPGANLLNIDREDVKLVDSGVYGDEFFEKLNRYLAYVFVGKGNAINKYINKTVYDCMSARCPVVVYSECDQNGVLFKNKEYYFSNEDELFEIYNKLKDPSIRERWIDEQRVEILERLEAMTDPFVQFSDYCKPSEGHIEGMKIRSLF